MRHRITILVALLTVALVACGRQDTTAGMATFQVSVPAEALAATGVISPDGVPMDPTGESAVETVVVQVYRDGTLVRFAETDGGLVASAPALSTSNRSPSICLPNPSAIWLRHEFPVHKK